MVQEMAALGGERQFKLFVSSPNRLSVRMNEQIM
jgi:hypothetical protein